MQANISHLQAHILFYLDDLLIHTAGLTQHYQVLQELFAILSKNNVVLQTNKSQMYQLTIEYLGFTIS